MINFIEQAKEMLEKEKKILKEIIVQRKMAGVSTFIFLTNKKIIYWKYGVFSQGFKTINLSEISAMTYLPQIFHSAGLIKAISKRGENILLSPSYVNQLEAHEFINKVKEKIN